MLVPRSVWWLVAIGCALAVVVAARQTGRSLPRVSDPASTADPTVDGRSLYVNCQACHGIEGLGITGFAPPLRGSPVLLGDPVAAARLTIHGSISSARWPQPMPGLGNRLSNQEIAVLLSWLRQQWGHQASMVSATQVDAARPWTTP